MDTACSFIIALGLAANPGPRSSAPNPTDPRNIQTGLTIPDEGYCDQPYVIVTPDGNWLCTLTTGKGHEGQRGQHVVATISRDKGRTWSPLVDIEPADGPPASWAMPLLTPSGRVYVFYDYDGDRVGETTKEINGKKVHRTDMLGWYVYKYSDDNGRTWSPKRYRLPVRQTSMDDANDWHGKVQMLWGIGKPIIADRNVYLGFSKIGKYLIDLSEGWFFRSDNILAEPDPAKHDWTMLPDGDIGLRSPAGPIAEEQNLVALSDGSLYTVYRTIEGHPCHAYSRDGGRTWTPPAYATYTPGGRLIKHPRACPRLWKAKNGNYLLWFHNHGGKDYEGRNPAWISGGIEKDGHIHWSQPEILFYDPDPKTRMSYPDLIEQDGRYWITETQKTVARVHAVDPTLLEGLWNQGKIRTVTKHGLVLTRGASALECGGRDAALPSGEAGPDHAGQAGGAGQAESSRPAVPRLPDLRLGGGFTIELWLQVTEDAPDRIIVDSRDETGKGIVLKTTGKQSVRLDMNDGRTTAGWSSDDGSLTPGRPHHLVTIVDAGPRIISFVVDGVLCDGGASRQYGWGRFPETLGDVNGSTMPKPPPSDQSAIRMLRIYDRPLRVSEAVSNYLAGAP